MVAGARPRSSWPITRRRLAEVGGEQRLRAVAELEAGDPVAVCTGLVDRVGGVGDLAPLEVPLAAEAGLAGAGMAGRRRPCGQPQVLHPERGGSPHDRPDVHRCLHAVEDRRDAALGAPPPSRWRRFVPVASSCLIASPGATRPQPALTPAPRRRQARWRSRGRAGLAERESCGIRYPWRDPRRSTVSRSGEPLRRGAPDFFDDGIGGAGGVERVSHVVRSSWTVADADGRLEQISSNATSSGGDPTRTLVIPFAAAFASHRARARSFTSTAHTVASGARRAGARAIGP